MPSNLIAIQLKLQTSSARSTIARTASSKLTLPKTKCAAAAVAAPRTSAARKIVRHPYLETGNQWLFVSEFVWSIVQYHKDYR